MFKNKNAQTSKSFLRFNMYVFCVLKNTIIKNILYI